MESKKINQLATELTPALSDLTIIGDPTTGISKKITLSQMASLFTGTVEEYANLAAFPLVGTADTIYIALDTNVIYRWNTGTSAYVELSPNIVTSLVFSDANGFDGTISLVGSTATLTITTALTTGSVPFIGASGALSQDNANLFFDDTNNRFGINTNAPTTSLDVFGSGIIGRLNGTSTNNVYLGFASAGTNKWSIGNVQSDHRFRIYSEANTAELVSVLQTGEFGIGIANPTTKIHIDGGASALIANLDANVSVAKSISFRSDNSNRINLEVSGTESGSNAGADLFIRRYSDAGALIDTPLTIVRSTGNIQILNKLSIGNTNSTFTLDVTGTFRIATPNRTFNISTNAYSLSDGVYSSGFGMDADGLYLGSVTSGTGWTISNPQLSIARTTGNATFAGDIIVSKTASPSLFLTNTSVNGKNYRLISKDDGTFNIQLSGISDLLTMTSTGASTFQGSLTINGTFVQNPSSGSGGLYIDRGTSTQSPYISWFNGSGSRLGYMGFSNTNIGLYLENSASFVINGGNAGIGVIPSAWGTSSIKALQVGNFGSLAWTGGIDINIFNNAYYDGTNFKYIASQEAARYLMNRNNHHWYIAAAGSAGNNITFTEAARINSSGYAKFTSTGSFNDVNAQNHEFVNGTAGNNSHFIGNTNGSFGGATLLRLNCVRVTTNGTYNLIAATNGNSSGEFIVRDSGNCLNTNNSYTGTSDIKLKQDIIDASSQWEDIKQMRIRKFRFKKQVEQDENAPYLLGVIAQELELVSPNLVDETPDFDGTDEEVISTTKSVKYSIIYMKAVKALQEAMEKIEILEEKVKQLELK
jgi:hypothetical protein